MIQTRTPLPVAGVRLEVGSDSAAGSRPHGSRACGGEPTRRQTPGRRLPSATRRQRATRRGRAKGTSLHASRSRGPRQGGSGSRAAARPPRPRSPRPGHTFGWRTGDPEQRQSRPRDVQRPRDHDNCPRGIASAVASARTILERTGDPERTGGQERQRVGSGLAVAPLAAITSTRTRLRPVGGRPEKNRRSAAGRQRQGPREDRLRAGRQRVGSGSAAGRQRA